MLSPLSHREQAASTKKIPDDTGLPSSGTLGPAFRAGLLVYLLSSLTATGVRPQTAVVSVTSSEPDHLVQRLLSSAPSHLPSSKVLSLGIVTAVSASLRARACFHSPPEEAWRLEGFQWKEQRREPGALTVPTGTPGSHSEPFMEPPPGHRAYGEP